MRIWNLTTSNEAGAYEITGILGNAEYKQLEGQLRDLCVFSRSTVQVPATAIKTGARHSYAKYLLFPVVLRRKYQTDRYDFGKVRCGSLRYRDTLYVLYSVPGLGTDPLENGAGADDARSRDGAASRKWTRYPSLRRWISALHSKVVR